MKRYAGARRLDDIDWDAWQPVDRATLLFVVDGERVLLIRKKRGLGAGKINGPGGRIDAGETPLQGAVREVHEEVGVVPHGIEPSGELRFQFVDGYSIHVWVFRASAFAGQPLESDEAVPLWTPLHAIPYEQMWQDDEHWLPLLFAGRPFTGRFVFDGETMLDLQVDASPLAKESVR